MSGIKSDQACLISVDEIAGTLSTDCDKGLCYEEVSFSLQLQLKKLK